MLPDGVQVHAGEAPGAIEALAERTHVPAPQLPDIARVVAEPVDTLAVGDGGGHIATQSNLMIAAEVMSCREDAQTGADVVGHTVAADVPGRAPVRLTERQFEDAIVLASAVGRLPSLRSGMMVQVRRLAGLLPWKIHRYMQ